MTALRSLPALLAVAAVAIAIPARATGPLANCESGVPFLWPAGGANIPFNPDQGNLGPLLHDEAVAAVAGAFGVWGDVPSSTASYLQGALLPVDVDITNFDPWLNPAAPDGLSAIVFDDTGAIFDLIFGPGSGVLGFAGPEFADPATCTILEGVSFLNGPSFEDLVAAQDVMVHEFGHYSNLAHTVVNGQLFLTADETSGPNPFDTFGPPPDITVIETMYPFYFGPGSGMASPERDDVAGISTLYPEPTFASTTGSIAGTILLSNGTTRVSGVNVIARNVADPFLDAVSAVSGDYTDAIGQGDPVVGTYRLNGLTPGASYAVFVDQILDGGFSTPPVILPGPEELYNGANESSVAATDDPAELAPVASNAGTPTAGIDVVFNAFVAGEALPVGDDGAVELALPFPFELCGQEFGSVVVNANGSLTFGAPSPDFSESVPELLSGPPRIAGLWDDLDPSSGGTVTFEERRNGNEYTVRWTDVPQFGAGDRNTFAITLRRGSSQARIEWGGLDATDGLAGLSCGAFATSGFENETELRRNGRSRTLNLNDEAAAFEIFTASDNDLDGYELTFSNFDRDFRDAFRNNDDFATARRVDLPFTTAKHRDFTELEPSGGDVDYFSFGARAGDIFAIEIVRGGFDAVLGLFDADTGELLAANDDGGGGLLSRLLVQAPVDIRLAVAVSAFPDLDFSGDGVGAGRYVLEIRRYRGATLLDAGDDTSTEVALPFPFRFGGTAWSSVFVNSNGNLTFGAGSGDFSESVPELLAGPPRIAPLWDDLDAGGGLVLVTPGRNESRIDFVSVPEFFSDVANYFTVTLARGGDADVDWFSTARSDALVGRSVGNGAADPGEADLSERSSFSGRTVYEQFVASSPPEPFDLNHEAARLRPAP